MLLGSEILQFSDSKQHDIWTANQYSLPFVAM